MELFYFVSLKNQFFFESHQLKSLDGLNTIWLF